MSYPNVVVPYQATTDYQAEKYVQSQFPTSEYPQRAKVLVKKAGNPILIYDEATQRLLALNMVTTLTPLTGTTVVGHQGAHDELLEIEPAGTIAALTLELETGDLLPVGSIKKVAFSQIVTTLTVAPNSLSTGSIKGAAKTSAAVNDVAIFEKIGNALAKGTASVWRRLV